MSVFYTKEEVRGIIQGKLSYRKCPCCDNDGLEWWDGMTGLGVGPSPPHTCSVEDLSSGQCQSCGGVAYIIG